MTNKNYNQETEIVQYLFGSQEEVETVLSSFASSYNRLLGRFYICSKVLCFYSNTLGFEKKLSIRIPDLVSANIRRNTSIIIQCQSEDNSIVEEYVFRSFNDRFVVLDCICKVYYEFTGETISWKRGIELVNVLEQCQFRFTDSFFTIHFGKRNGTRRRVLMHARGGSYDLNSIKATFDLSKRPFQEEDPKLLVNHKKKWEQYSHPLQKKSHTTIKI